jgi:Glutathione synthase/Ribosomal protein S6 modification enzyme (glutaminyl transferase)
MVLIMEAWLIYYRAQAEYNQQYIRFYQEEGAKLGIQVKLLLIEDMEFGVQNNKWFISYQKQPMKYPDFAVCRVIYPLLNRQLEYLGIRVFNNSFVAEICNDKAKTYQYLAKTGIKMVDTSFYRNSQISMALSRVQKPSVIKAVDGHGGSQVFLYDNDTEKLDIIKRMSNSDAVVQPLVGTRHQDLRVYVIGKKIIASVLRTAKDGFKANYSLGGEVCLYELSCQEKMLIHKIMEQFDFGMVGIDFIIGDEGELIFNEIEDVVGSRMLYQCSEINIVRKYLEYIIDNITSER